jgi:hypothetical protein
MGGCWIATGKGAWQREVQQCISRWSAFLAGLVGMSVMPVTPAAVPKSQLDMLMWDAA